MRLVIMLFGLAACAADDPAPSPAAGPTSHERMVAALRDVRDRTPDDNPWLGDKVARELRPQVAALPDEGIDRDQWWLMFRLAVEELRIGNEEEAVQLLRRVVDLAPKVQPPVSANWRNVTTYRLGVAYVRLAETQNCCAMSKPDSCTLPLAQGGIHTRTDGARGAIEAFTAVLRNSKPSDNLHLASRWLLNLAYMFIDEHPDGVPEAYRIPAAAFVSEGAFPRFENIATRAGLDTFSLSGGTVADDFDNDGYLDLLVSTWETNGQIRLHRSNQDGTFVDRTAAANLTGIFGGLNMVQADFDNDGNVDVYVLRGAWLDTAGRHPNSLLRNNGDGTFTDVTFAAGLGEAHYPTQTAAWADYDLDGDVDLYVGNEASENLKAPSQLFRNNGDGTFTDVAEQAGVTNLRYTKGVVWGDYDGDRYPDIYVTTLEENNRLYRNNGDGTFTDLAVALGMTGPQRAFPTWFWDFDNDGHLDLYVSGYAADVWHLAQAALGLPLRETELASLWRGNGKGAFVDVARQRGLTRPNSPMGANFGDLDNDGYLDFYLGTGFPSYDTVMPNVMYRNAGGERFVDVSTTGGFAHLQKGHAVVFADLDNDGDQDVFEQMGGAYKGDGFYDVLYENPGFGNHWVAVRLVGTKSNRSAIGARIRVVLANRSVYKQVNSGGTFGANPLRQSIGLGKAEKIERIEVYWPKTDRTQIVKGVPVDSFVRITEGKDGFERIELKKLALKAKARD